MARITVWLFIEAPDLTLEEISARIGLVPDKSWKIGDPRGKTGKVFETNSWTLESRREVDENPMVVCENLQFCLNDVLHRIENYADRYKNVASGRTAGLYLGIFADEAPAVKLQAATIKAISALAVDLEIDLMLYNDSDSG